MKRILIAEDDFPIAELLFDVLTDEGYAVELVHEGTEVIPAIRAQRPDLIILDIGLPGMQGDDVLRVLRLIGMSDLPVIVSTAARNPELYKEIGATAALPKPYSLDTLLDVIASCMG